MARPAIHPGEILADELEERQCYIGITVNLHVVTKR